jgi:serine/threonine-protein kinase RsbW
MPEHPTYALTLPSEPQVLSVARAFVESVGVACGLQRQVVHALVLATGEAVTNIVRHAHRHLNAAQFHLHMEIQKDAVVLTFQDQGDPFDLASFPHLNPGELRIGGRGIYLLRTLMDELSCEPLGPNQPGNRLRMVKRYAAAGAIRECG